jgi:hypothetical protein
VHRFPYFDTACALIGMVHLGPLLEGTSGPTLDAVEGRAVMDALILARAGFDALIVENYGDAPFLPGAVEPHTVASMSRIIRSIQMALEESGVSNPLPSIGVNVLRNDAMSALGIAAATGTAFIRVNVHSGAMLTDQGLIEGNAHQSVRYRDRITPNCAIFADVHVKHASPLVVRPIEEEAREVWERGKADAVIVSGIGTGAPTDPDDLHRVASALPDCPIVVGSGVCPENLEQMVPHARALIVGTWIKEGGLVENPVDPGRCGELVRHVQKIGGAY